jgi:hypothetical protein
MASVNDLSRNLGGLRETAGGTKQNRKPSEKEEIFD